MNGVLPITIGGRKVSFLPSIGTTNEYKPYYGEKWGYASRCITGRMAECCPPTLPYVVGRFSGGCKVSVSGSQALLCDAGSVFVGEKLDFWVEQNEFPAHFARERRG